MAQTGVAVGAKGIWDNYTMKTPLPTIVGQVEGTIIKIVEGTNTGWAWVKQETGTIRLICLG